MAANQYALMIHVPVLIAASRQDISSRALLCREPSYTTAANTVGRPAHSSCHTPRRVAQLALAWRSAAPPHALVGCGTNHTLGGVHGLLPPAPCVFLEGTAVREHPNGRRFTASRACARERLPVQKLRLLRINARKLVRAIASTH